MSELPSGVVTFLFTDIEGSTRLLGEFGVEAYALALAEHHRALRAAFAGHRGIEMGTEGDAVFAVFERASDAVAAAQEAQAALARGRIRVRMGIHSGEPFLTDEGYVGMDLHRAARIAAAGHGGQVLVSGATRALLDPSTELRDLGAHRLKDLAEAEHLFQLGEDGFPSLRSLGSTNLPEHPSPMVGRDPELTRLAELLQGGRSRLVTLTGPGGTGKTRLAIEAASTAAPGFADGVCLVELAPVTDPQLVASAIASSLGAQERGARGIEEELVAHLGSRSMLLVLDNFEQVLDAAPLVSRLLRACPRLSVLVTSRAALRLTGEQEFPVPPLRLPRQDAFGLEEVGRSEAVVLFVLRAQSVEPGFALTEATAASVAQICLRLEGLPLAIELAAARVKLLDPRALLARLERRLPLLTGGPRDAPERHRTLRATIEWSYDLLGGAEQMLLDRLAVFAGTFSLEAAEEIAFADLDGISTLLSGNLLRSSGGGRFSLLEMIREYAEERLGDSDAASDLRRRHAEHFLAVAERAETELAGPEQLLWLDLLEADHDNLRAALAWLGGHEHQLQVRMTVALRRFWYVRGYLSEGRRSVEAALDAGAPAPRLALRATSLAAAFALLQGDYDHAIMRATQGVDFARTLGEPAALANALSNLGATVLAAGDIPRAGTLLEEAVSSARGAGDGRVLALALNNLGDVALTAGDYALAGARFEESLAILRERRDAANVARSLFNLGAVALRLGKLDDAVWRLRESIVLCQGLGDREDLAWCLEGFAAVAVSWGDAERAGILLGAAGALLGEMGAALKPFERQLHDETTASVRASLGEDGLTRTAAAGRALTLDEAVEHALAGDGVDRQDDVLPP